MRPCNNSQRNGRNRSRQASNSAAAAFDVELLALVDQRINDVGLASRFESFAHEGKHFAEFRLGREPP